MKTCSRCGELMHEQLQEVTKVVDPKGNIDYYCNDCFRILYPKQSELFFQIQVDNDLRRISEDARKR